MSDPSKTQAGTEADRREQGVGHRQTLQGSEESRGNETPAPADVPHAEHASRTIQGTAGPIEIVEDSGVAAADVDSKPS